MLFRFCFVPGRWKVLLSLLALWLLAAGAAAPQPAAPPPPAAAAPADTSAAVRRLFAERQSNSTTGRVISAAFLVVFANYSLSYATYDTPLQRAGTGLSVAVLGYEAFTLVQVLHWRHRYSKAREQALLAALAQGQPLPPRLRRRLKAKYFTAPAPAH